MRLKQLFQNPQLLRVVSGALLGSSLVAVPWDRAQWLELSGLPVYTAKDVAQHKDKESRIWVTYLDGVYDITDFVSTHPGGDKILLAAGAAVDPFWRLYAQHKTDEVQHILQQYKIGTLEASEVVPVDPADPFSGDPARHPALRAHNTKPFNGETPGSLLTDSLITPNELFFVRNHLPVPHVDIKEYRLTISIGDSNTQFTVDELKAFPMYEVTTTIQCAGNRRSELNQVKPTAGLRWASGAASTAVWRGVRLRDVLLALGINPDLTANLHCQFEGLDHGPDGVTYGSSIPLAKAMSPETLLAFEMNGEEIPLDHGYPLRVIVPGVVGARNVKWLGAVRISSSESSSFWQQTDYRVFPPTVDTNGNTQQQLGPAIQETPVTSAITSHSNGAVVEDDEIEVSGYAVSGGGAGIVRVELSTDKGATWALVPHTSIPQPVGQQWAWSLFKTQLTLPNTENCVCVRAVDTRYNSQPSEATAVWNPRGLLNNSYHCVNITKRQEKEENTTPAASVSSDAKPSSRGKIGNRE